MEDVPAEGLTFHGKHREHFMRNESCFVLYEESTSAEDQEEVMMSELSNANLQMCDWRA